MVEHYTVTTEREDQNSTLQCSSTRYDYDSNMFKFLCGKHKTYSHFKDLKFHHEMFHTENYLIAVCFAEISFLSYTIKLLHIDYVYSNRLKW